MSDESIKRLKELRIKMAENPIVDGRQVYEEDYARALSDPDCLLLRLVIHLDRGGKTGGIAYFSSPINYKVNAWRTL